PSELLPRSAGAPVPGAASLVPPPLPAAAPAPSGDGHAGAGAREAPGNGHPVRAAKPAVAPPATNGHAAPASPPRAEAPAGPSVAELEGKVIEVMARITAHPPGRLGPA